MPRCEGVIDHLSDWQRGYELEEIGHEEDSLRILKVMEDAGWMKRPLPGLDEREGGCCRPGPIAGSSEPAADAGS